MPDWIKGKVIENYRWNHRLCSLRVAADLPGFQAGQFVKLGLPVQDTVLSRPYSLVNAPSDPVAEFYFNLVPEGPLSPHLHRLEAGDEVLVSDLAAGFFVLSEVPAARVLWMLATGTAIGPFLSILKTEEPWRRFEQIILVHGVKQLEEATYQALTNEIEQRRQGQFTRINSVTRETVPGTLPIRISDAIDQGKLEEEAGLAISPEEAHVMICGSPAMVGDCLQLLQERGMKKHRRREAGQITIEIYK